MQLLKTWEAYHEDLSQTFFDVMIAASGYESRASYFYTKDFVKGDKKVVFSFAEYNENIVKQTNDMLFDSMSFERITCSGNESKPINEYLNKHLNPKGGRLKIIVDYTSMTRVWYASIISFLRSSMQENAAFDVYFVYSNSLYVPPQSQMNYNKYVNPIEGFYSVSVPAKPSAVVIGLGYVESRAFGLSEFFDVKPYLFIADASSSDEYYNDVVSKNYVLLKSTPEENVFLYPLNGMKYTETLLYRLCKDLESDYRIILAPCGPKPFTLLCLTTSLRFSEIDVWRISAGQADAPVDKKASGQLNVFALRFGA
jgi:hypothetical protein